MGRQTAALVLRLDAICQTITDLAEGVEEASAHHPDAAIITPGRASPTNDDEPTATDTSALRNLFNRLLGCRYHCLRW